MEKIDRLVRKIKRSRNRATMLKNLNEVLRIIKEERELIKLRLAAVERERDEYRAELDEIHKSISYRVGRWIAETRIGGWLKKILRKYIWK